MFFADRAIIIVRNPIDCITSHWHMMTTKTHGKSMDDDQFKRFGADWNEWIQQELSVWRDFTDFWMAAKIPRYIIRYEDLVGNPEPTMKKLMEYILNVPDIEGTFVHKRVK